MISAIDLDLSDSLPIETYDLHLLKPGTDVRSGWVVHLAGPQHPLTIAATNDAAREVLEKEKAIEFAQVNGRKYKIEDESVETRRRKNVRRVCQRIIGWSPAPTFKIVQPGPLEFSIDAATDLFMRRELAGYFIQITEYLNGERAFMPPSEPV